MLSGLVVTLLLALVCLPCLLFVLLRAEGTPCVPSRRVRRARVRWAEWRLAYRAGLGRRFPGMRVRVHAAPVGPPIEQLAADLRRLDRQRIGLAAHSPLWFNAVSTAYDNRLAVACRELEICEHLYELTGVDLEVERLRVEGMLLAAGLRLHSGEARAQREQS